MSVEPPSQLTPDHAQRIDQELLEVMPGGVVFVKADGSITKANAAALAILGLTEDVLTGRFVTSFETETIHEDGSRCPAEQYPVARALATGEPQPGMTLGVRRASGDIVWAVFRATPVRGADGHVNGAVVTFIDITARKQAEQEVERSRDLLRRAQGLAQVGCWEWELGTERVRWTDGMCAIHGITEAEFRGDLEASLSLIHPDDRARVTERTRIAMEQGVAMPTEYRVVRPDGSVRSVWATGELVASESGKPKRMVGAVQDITERKELEDRLRQMQRMESVGQLAAGIAHDFNNLLQVVLGNVMVCLGDKPGSVELEQAQAAAERAADLTRQLLAFGRREEFQPAIVSVDDLVREVEPMLRRTLAERVQLRLQLQAARAAINADRGQLRQVLTNLCLNALDAMPDGGTLTLSTARVRCDPNFRRHRGWARMEHYLEIAVRDTGVGLEPEVERRMFEPFFTTKQVGKGSGLGLSAAYGIIQQHEGMIEAESQPGKGATFRVYLPEITPGHASPSPRVEDEPRATLGVVLVVEDEPMVRDLVARTLRRAGYAVDLAENGRVALGILERAERETHLVLTDVVMPEMGGVELARHVRVQYPNLPILFTTGYADTDIEEATSEGVLRKPYAPQELLRRVGAAVEKGKSACASGTYQRAAN